MNDTPINLLAEILRKAQGVVDAETGKAVDIGGEVTRLRKHLDLAVGQQRKLVAEIRFLADRIDEWCADYLQGGAALRDWLGHVEPPLTRAKALVNTDEQEQGAQP